MASYQTVGARALQPITRVVDNTAALAIRQWAVTSTKHRVRTSDMPGGAGTFSPYGNIAFLNV